MWNDLEPTKKIAQELGCSVNHVLRVAKQLNLAGRYNSGGFGDIYDSYIIKYHEQGMPILKQVDKIGVGADFIKKRRRILGLSVPAKKK